MIHQTKHLLIVFQDMRLGGIQRKIIDLINYTGSEFPDIKITLCLREKKGLFLKKIPSHIQIISPTFYTRRFNTIWFTIWLISQLSKLSPSHILSFMDLGSIPTIIASTIIFWQKPQITIGEDILTSKYVYIESFPILRLLLIKIIYRFAHKILVQTPIQKLDLEKIIYSTKKNANIIVSPNWLPLDFPPTPNIPTNLRSTDILYVGRFDDQKNLSLFVKIVIQVKKKYPNLRVKMVGGGSFLTSLQKLIIINDLSQTIELVSTTLESKPYYSNSKIFLLTSLYEGFPLTILEAISSRCVTLSSSLPEINQFFKRDQSKFIYLNIHQATTLILKYLKKPPQKLISKYSKLVVQNQKKLLHKYLNNILVI